MLVLLIVLLLVFGGGGYAIGPDPYRVHYGTGGLGLVLIILVVLYLMGYVGGAAPLHHL